MVRLPWSKEEEGAYIFWMKQVPVIISLRLSFGHRKVIKVALRWTPKGKRKRGPSPLRLNIFRLFVILSLTQLYRYTPEIFLFSTATFKYIYRAPLRRIGQEYSANVACFIRIQPLPVCTGFFICIRNSLDRPCVTMPSWSSPLKCKVSL
jgi:hypothetical protein